MEATPDAKVEINSSDKGKKKRNWGHAFYTFLVSGVIMVVLALGFGLAILISVLFYRK